MKQALCQYSSDKTKTLVETAIYRVSKTQHFLPVALNPSVLGFMLGFETLQQNSAIPESELGSETGFMLGFET